MSAANASGAALRQRRRRMRLGAAALALGFTMIELLTVLAVLALITTIAAPGMRSFAAGQRVRALAFDLNADLLLARNEALKRNTAITVTPRSEGWAAGWTVAAGTTTVAAREASGAAVQFSGAPTAITFNLHGRVASPTAAVRITLSDEGSGEGAERCVELDISGRARTLKGVCS